MTNARQATAAQPAPRRTRRLLASNTLTTIPDQRPLCRTTGKKNGQRKDDEGKLIELGPDDVLRKRVGLVVADASNLFDESFKRDDLIECGCNAHGRRGFFWHASCSPIGGRPPGPGADLGLTVAPSRMARLRHVGT